MIRLVLVVSAVAVCLAGTAASAQVRRPEPDPQRLQEPRRAPLVVTPSITVTEEFNDNVNLDNDNKRWDFITAFTPALTVVMEQPTYRLAAGYSFTSELFWRDQFRNHAFDRQNFSLDTQWLPTERWTLSLADTFTFDNNTNLIAPEGISTGRGRAWSNTLTPGVQYRLTELTTLRTAGSWTVLRFDSDDEVDSDAWRGDVAVDHRFTRQLIGTVQYQFAYFDIENEPKSTVHTPRLGVQYQLTPTISLALSGGPSFEMRDGEDTRVTPAVTAAYRQRVSWGSLGVSYDRGIGTAGGLGGTTINQRASGTLEWTTLMKGLVLSFVPSFSTSESDDDRDDERGRIDERTWSLGFNATYRITAWLSALASYTFFQQRSDSTVLDRGGRPLANDADQNRVWVGVTLGYPIRFD